MGKVTYKIFAIIFSFLCMGAVSEVNRILTSKDAVIVENRVGITIAMLIVTAIIVAATIHFWKKSR